jgi:hypothetical protein
MNFCSTVTVSSQAYPEVSYTIRRMTEGTRTDLMLGLAETLSQIRDIQADVQCLDLPPRKADGTGFEDGYPVDPHVLAKAAALNDKVRVLRKSTVDPAYAKVCLVGVQGITIDGVDDPTDPDFIRRFGPERLYGDIITSIRAEVEMSEEDKENLESPITSDAVAGGQTNDMIASSAVSKDSTSTETATSSSQGTSTQADSDGGRQSIGSVIS